MMIPDVFSFRLVVSSAKFVGGEHYFVFVDYLIFDCQRCQQKWWPTHCCQNTNGPLNHIRDCGGLAQWTNFYCRFFWTISNQLFDTDCGAAARYGQRGILSCFVLESCFLVRVTQKAGLGKPVSPRIIGWFQLCQSAFEKVGAKTGQCTLSWDFFTQPIIG